MSSLVEEESSSRGNSVSLKAALYTYHLHPLSLPLCPFSSLGATNGRE